MSKDLEPAEKVEPPCRIYYLQSSSGKVYRCYRTSEADKVIAEKDGVIDELEEHIDELQKATDSAWSKVNVYYDELRHHKYKRCMAMAEWCNSEMGRETFACFRPRNTKEVWREEHKYWAKWRKIWFGLYKKFKEAK